MNGRGRSTSARALRRLAAFLDEISDEDFDGFVKGTLTIELARRTREGLDGAVSADDEIAASLRSTATRQEALDLLRSKKRTRAELAHLARQLQIHVEKHDKVELLEEKIIENVIGARLRSGAIQGINLKGSSPDGSNGAQQTEESAPVPGSQTSKDDRNLAPRRAPSAAQRNELRKRLTELSDQLLTSTRDPDWWRARFDADIPNLVERVDAAIESSPNSDDLIGYARIMQSRLDRIETDVKKGATIGIEQTQHLATALADVAGSLMRA